jgi:hypothetical protein
MPKPKTFVSSGLYGGVSAGFRLLLIMRKLSSELSYSKRQIRDAGKLLGTVAQRSAEIEDAFRILHNWRWHHAYPMVRERSKLTRIVKPLGGFTAGRLKRTSSIRKKLFRSPIQLDRIQDLVGCRAILPDMESLHATLEKYESIEKGGRVQRHADYIATPKESGYRSAHLIVKFDESGVGERHAGCKVELQLRTQLQHVWGTTVEAAGSMRNEDLKAGEGDPKWLRFLTLMSGHIAELERQPRGEHLTMSYRELKAEIKELSRQLRVAHNLQTFSEFMNEADAYDGAYSSSYVLKMDANTGNISVQPTWRDIFEFDDLDEQPGEDFQEKSQSLEVSVDNMKALRQAYPNYFADTGSFLEILNDLDGRARPKSVDSLTKLDLTFLKNMSSPKSETKMLSLLSSGYVYWDGELVGMWEKGNFGHHFFRSSNGSHPPLEAEGYDNFTAALREWFEDE